MIERLMDMSLRNRLLMMLLGVLVLASGIWSWQKLAVDAVPDVSPTLVQVFTVTDGLAPEEVETYVSYPVEQAMTGLPKVREIRSNSNFGLSVVSVYFEDGTDIYHARQLVNERLQKARESIPEGFGEPQMGPIASGQGLILYYYLDAPRDEYDLTQLRTIQDWLIKPKMETVRGVTGVLGIGGYKKQYQVNVNPDALQRYDLDLQSVIERVQSSNLNVGAQFLEEGGEQFVIRSEGLARGVKDLQRITVKTVDGTPVRLADIASVEIGGEVRQGLQTLNGEKEVVSGMVVKLYGANTSAVIQRVEERLASIQESLPEGVEIVPYYEQKTLVQNAVDTVSDALFQGIVLVVLVLFVFMGGFRPSVVVAAAIPFSVLFAVVGMYWFDISANLMSLGGLAIAIGLMVDGTIVMVENIDRHLHEAQRYEPRIQVVAQACREVASPILFAIAIIVVVFLPLFTLTGVAGKTFRPLAYTVALGMVGSLFYALFVTPVLGSLMMRRPKEDAGDGKQRWWHRLTPSKPIAGDSEDHGYKRESLIVQWILVVYRPVLRFFIARRSIAVALAIGLLGMGAALFPQLGSEFAPRMDEGDLIVNMTFAPSISLSEAKRNTMLAEKRMLSVPGVKKTVSRVGRGEVGAHADPINTVHSLVVLEPRSKWDDLGYESQAGIEQAIRERLEGMPGIMTNMTQPIQLSVDELVGGVKSELAVKLYGDDLDKLKEKADAIAAVMREIPGAADVKADQVIGAPQMRIRPDRDALARYGIRMEQVQKRIRNAVGGTTAGQIFEGIRRFDVYVRYQEKDRKDLDAISNILIEAPSGAEVPLSQLAELERISGPRQISRENAQRYITVQANVENRDIGSFVEEGRAAISEQVELPTGYLLEWGGQYELQQKANARFAIVIPVTLVLICLMLYISFRSVRSTALILLNIPLALVGGIAALWLSGQNLSVPASVGFIALFGIALENGMVLVTYLNQLVREGMNVDEASIQGACLRVRPVLMTALTTSLGLLPLLVATGTGSGVQRPLATVVVGGLITSTLLTLVVIPALYRWFAERRVHDPED